MRELSQYIRTVCCQAPVFQELEIRAMVCPVRCVACGREAGAPGVEDVPENQAEAIDRANPYREVGLISLATTDGLEIHNGRVLFS